MKREALLVFLALALVFMLSSVSATLVFTNLSSSVYNIGDDFSAQAVITPDIDTNSFFTARLVCSSGSGDIEIYKAPYKISAGQSVNVNISARLESSLIGISKGNCVLKSDYLNDSAISRSFEISSEILLSVFYNQTEFNPGSNPEFEGSAIKKNNNSLKGYIRFSNEELGLDKEESIGDGNFKFIVSIPGDAKAKNYIIKVEGYEKNSDGDVINEGTIPFSFKVKQILTKIDIATSLPQVDPGQELTYSVILEDQAKDMITDASADVSILSPNKINKETKTLKSGENAVFKPENNAAPGIWTISAKSGTFATERLFAVAEKEIAEFSMVNDTLLAKNTGNVPYKRTIDVLIGDNRTLKQEINLAVGESAQYKLYAPSGEYAIKVNSGDATQELGRAYLTGSAISVQGLKDIAGSKYAIVFWIILILIIAWLVYKNYGKIRKPSFMGRASNYSSPIKVTPMASAQPASGMNSPTGNKQECLVLALRIKNLEELRNSQSNAMETISIVLSKARENKASVYEQNEFRIMIIPKVSAIGEDLSSLGARLIKDINDLLQEHNNKYSQKINYGLGANIGELIVEHVNGRFKYGPIGSTILTARKIAEAADSDALISENIRNRAMTEIKVERKGEYWKILSIKNKSAHSEFIDKFMSRNKFNRT